MKTLLFILLLTLTGCMTLDQQIDKAGAIAGAPQWKIDAVKHGCRSGRAAAGDNFSRFTKDYEQYKTNTDYAMVYDDWYNQCKGKYEANARLSH